MYRKIWWCNKKERRETKIAFVEHMGMIQKSAFCLSFSPSLSTDRITLVVTYPLRETFLISLSPSPSSPLLSSSFLLLFHSLGVWVRRKERRSGYALFWIVCTTLLLLLEIIITPLLLYLLIIFVVIFTTQQHATTQFSFFLVINNPSFLLLDSSVLWKFPLKKIPLLSF